MKHDFELYVDINDDGDPSIDKPPTYNIKTQVNRNLSAMEMLVLSTALKSFSREIIKMIDNPEVKK